MTGSGNPWRRAAFLTAALLLLNAAVTFENIWPTPAITWRGGISIELAAALLALALFSPRVGARSRRIAAGLAAVWFVLAVGRYAEVTAPALYGREVNLYWDLRFIPDVAAMVVRVAPLWLVTSACAVAAVLVWLLLRSFAWSFGEVLAGLERRATSRLLAAASALVVLAFGAERLGVALPVTLAGPVTQTYAHQLVLVAKAHSGAGALPPTPSMECSFDRLDGADVFLVFIESYGAVGFTGGLAPQLAAARAQLADAIAATGRRVASAFVESPTFGGSSWLAHLSLLSGVEVRDPDTNALLMAQPRDTLVKSFGRHGFRTIALMPGLRQRWPEGRFYGFDEIYGADRLSYTGPEFGWFAIPDQYSLIRFDAFERERPAGRRFVFFPTISTHFPFSPTPPYQPDWDRLFTPLPYDGRSLVRAYSKQPDWTDFAPGYIDAIDYDYAVLGGYLRRWPNRPMVMILIGDHQPPAALSGAGASWNVPVHVIASNRSLLDRLEAHGFADGLTPAGEAIAPMHMLLPVLLDAFGGHD